MQTRTKVTILAAALLFGAQSIYACTGCGCSPKAKDHSHDLTTAEMKSTVESGEAVILDARSGKYDDGSRIPGAKALSSKSSAEEIAKTIPSKDAQVVTYCSNLKCPASKALATKLKDLGYTNVKEYPEGIAGWKEAGGKVEKR